MQSVRMLFEVAHSSFCIVVVAKQTLSRLVLRLAVAAHVVIDCPSKKRLFLLRQSLLVSIADNRFVN